MHSFIRIAVPLGAALFLSGCSTHRPGVVDLSPTTDAAAVERWVSSVDGRYGLRVPPGWSLKERGEDGSVLLTPDVDMAKGMIILRDFPTAMVPTDEALEQVRAGAIEGLAADMARFKLESDRELAIDGRRALQIRYGCAMSGERMEGNLTILVGEGGLYSVNAIAPRAVFHRADGAVKHLLASFRIDVQQATDTLYTDPGGRFTASLPSGWFLQDYQAPAAQSQAFHTFAMADGSDSAVVVARMEGSSITPSASRRVIATLEQGLLSRLGARTEEVQEMRPIRLGGRPAVLRRVSVRAADGPMYLYEVIQVSEREVTAIAAYGQAAWFERQRPGLEAFQASFDYLPGAEPVSNAVASR